MMDMSDLTDYAITDIARKLANLIIPGAIYSLDLDKARVKVKSGNMVTDWLPWLTMRAGTDRSWWSPDIGEQVILLCPDGNINQGWVLPAGYTREYDPPASDGYLVTTVYSDGTEIIYDKKSHTFEMNFASGANIYINNAGEIFIIGDTHITGNVTVNGSIEATGDIADKVRSMNGDRAIYNGHTHAGKVPAPSSTQ